jgi:hypothetical protein
MTHVVALRGFSLLLAAGLLSHCASAAPLRLQRPAGQTAQAISDINLPEGAECIVRLSGGDDVRGRIVRISAALLELEVRNGDGAVRIRRIPSADVALVAKVVKMSKSRRGWVGAAIGAAASVPFGISMVGDMVIPAAILGSVVGRGTGDSQGEVVFERRPQ